MLPLLTREETADQFAAIPHLHDVRVVYRTRNKIRRDFGGINRPERY